MYNNKKILSLITARGGSKGIPKKNIRILGDKPLIAWTIESSLRSKYIDRTILSSDCDEIIKISKKFGCDVPFKRSIELAQDNSSSMDVIIHALNNIKGYDYLVLLQPTSPFRHDGLIDDMISEIVDNDYNQLVSVKRLKKEPSFLYYKGDDGKLVPLTGEYVKNKRRQDQNINNVYEHNGSVYISKVDFLLEKKSYNCKETRMYEMFGKENIDIDQEIDLHLSKFYLNKFKV
jgi:CMP-N,N'-diacetyllegionaminic acid synthase